MATTAAAELLSAGGPEGVATAGPEPDNDTNDTNENRGQHWLRLALRRCLHDVGGRVSSERSPGPDPGRFRSLAKIASSTFTPARSAGPDPRSSSVARRRSLPAGLATWPSHRAARLWSLWPACQARNLIRVDPERQNRVRRVVRRIATMTAGAPKSLT